MGGERIAGDVLWSNRRIDPEDPATPASVKAIAADELNGTDFRVVIAADRSFSRETRNLKLFVVHDPFDDTTFARIIAAVSVRDNVWLEGSGGLFAGAADDTLGRLSKRDFVYARLKVFF